MKIVEALRVLDTDIDFKNLGYGEAWQTLKSAVLAQQTTNTASTPCPNCEDFKYIGNNYCRDCGYKLR